MGSGRVLKGPEEFMSYVATMNELMGRLRSRLRSVVPRDYLAYHSSELEIIVKGGGKSNIRIEVHAPDVKKPRRAIIKVSSSRAKNWGYLAHRVEHENASGDAETYYVVYVSSRLYLGELLLLYKMYEEGLFQEITTFLEGAVAEMQRNASMLKKVSVALSILGIPERR